MRSKIVLILISILIFLIPFFWLKPGEMDLGGDSSRLYFYDPASFLSHSNLYTISPSSYGGIDFDVSSFPYIFSLSVLKQIFHSPTILIEIFYGLDLSLGFLFVALTILNLIDDDKGILASIAGGLLYAFSPVFTTSYNHVLISYDQIFLNPLVFYFLLKYFKSANFRYILIILSITFFFSPDFSISGIPVVFSFYPLSIVFLLLYTKFILKKRIVVKHLILGLILLFGVQAFGLSQQLSSIFTKGSPINNVIFLNSNKFNRGLDYFLAIAPSVKASINLLMQNQMSVLPTISNAFIILPFLVTFALFFTKKKTILLTICIYLIALFFATANITNLGFSIYRSFFSIPGFSMFRNFFGKWEYPYVFFYSILIGQSLYVLFGKLKKFKFIIAFYLIFILCINALPLIQGDIVKSNLWQSQNVKGYIKIDPDYIKMLSYVKNLSSDCRILSLPLADAGYQIFSGTNGGDYMGPSSISYLAGKKDFTGYDDLGDYQDVLLSLLLNNQLESFKRMLGFMNIKYIIYDANPSVYDTFPTFPFQNMHLYFPNNQNDYKKFIDKLSLQEIKNINNKYLIFKIPDSFVYPQIYATKKSILFNATDTENLTPLSIDINGRLSVLNSVVYSDNNLFNVTVGPKISFDEDMTNLQSTSALSTLVSQTSINDVFSMGFGFANWSPSSPIYPFIIAREKKNFASLNVTDESEVNAWILLAEKRISELQRFGNSLEVLGNIKSISEKAKVWKEPASLLDALLHRRYSSWEISLVRYYQTLHSLTDSMHNAALSNDTFQYNTEKERVRRRLMLSKQNLSRAIAQSQFSVKQKNYLNSLARDMFGDIYNTLQPTIPSQTKVDYALDGVTSGQYDLFIDRESARAYDPSQIHLVAGGKTFSLDESQQNSKWLKISKLHIDKTINRLHLFLPDTNNVVSNNVSTWKLSESVITKGQSGEISLIDNSLQEGENGITKKIDNWKENSYYLISLDYRTGGSVYSLSILERTKIKNSSLSSIFQTDLRSEDWNTYKFIVPSNVYANEALIKIFNLENDEFGSVDIKYKLNKKIDIKNFSIVQIPNPKIIVKKINTINPEATPNVVFTRINPTKYVVHISNVYSPYTLVLMDQFDQKWQLIDPSQNAYGIGAFFTRLIAAALTKATGVIAGSTITNGDVFLNKATFNTWGKLTVAQDRHFPVNGYGNAWYILPQDMSGKKEYTFIIEMTSQRFFYIGLFISFFFLLLIFLFFIYIFSNRFFFIKKKS